MDCHTVNTHFNQIYIFKPDTFREVGRTSNDNANEVIIPHVQ